MNSYLENVSGNGQGKPIPEEYFDLKTKIHDRLLDIIDLSLIEKFDRNDLRTQIRELSESVLRDSGNGVPLNYREREKLFEDIQNEIMGLGPLEPFLKDPQVTDILVNTYQRIYVEKFGLLELTDARFKDDDHLLKIIDRIVSRIGRRIDESSPMVDARLPDGSRVNAIIPPLAIDGPMLSIRRFPQERLELEDLIDLKSLTPQFGEILKGIVKAKLNVLISGGTGSGKTTLLNILSRAIPTSERIVTIEDAAELQLKQEHVVRLETRPANIEGEGRVTQRDLVKNSLRMRPDRIIVGEVRGEEAFDMLQAMNTGHEGSLTTIHANSPRDALMRLETMIAMANFDIPSVFLRRYIASALDVVVHVSRLADGSRKLLSIQEITGMEGDVVTLQEIFAFEQTGTDSGGKVLGRFVCRGIRPQFTDRLHVCGIQLSADIFDPANVVEV